jgi:ubiquinone/menaquinone biosynthesis C-methylase UbiE
MPDRRGADPWFFDLWSRFYDAPVVQRLTYRPGHDAVLRELRRAPRSRLLDVGCGTGLLTSRMLRELQPEIVVGADFSQGMLRQAAREGPGPSWVRCDALRLPFAGESFDALVSTEAFHWFPDQDRALREFYRVLAPKGRLLVALVNPPAEWLSQATRLGSRLMGQPLTWPTRARLSRRLEAAGFRIEAQRTVFRLPAPLIFPCVLTSATRPG